MRCLLILPKHFYSFKDQFKTQLETRGYEVVVANDEYPEGSFGLLMGKLKLPWMKWNTYKVFRDKILPGNYFEVTIIFKGRGVSQKLIFEIKKFSKRIIAYNWDSFEFNSSPLNWMGLVDKYATFDIKDSLEYKIPLIELFTTTKDQLPLKDSEKLIKFSAVFRNHSDRLKYLDAAITHFNIKNEDIYIYIFEQNWMFKIINFLKSPFLYYKYKKFIFNNSLEYNKYLKIIKSSIYTLDYAHPKQTGLTMRCFDALNMNTSLITNNLFIQSSPNFINSKPIVFNMKTGMHIGEIDFSENLSTGKKRTLNNFFDDLLS